VIVKDPPVEIVDNFLVLGANAYQIYLFKGRDGGTLFEGGTGPMGPVLRGQVDGLGIANDFVKQLVVTHAHPDHVMAVPMLREMFSDVAVLASEPAAKTLSVEKAVSFFCKMDDQLTCALIDAGIVTEEQRRPPMTESQIAVDRVLKDGDLIEVDDGVSFEVLQTPGHSDCSLSFHEPSRKILIISDATGYYLPDHEYWWHCYFADYAAYVASIERLAGLGAEILCLGHNAVIQGADDVAAYLRGAVEDAKRCHQRIMDDYKSDKSPRQIAEALGSEVYQKTQLMPEDFFQKNCGLLVKNSLRHEGIELEK